MNLKDDAMFVMAITGMILFALLATPVDAAVGGFTKANIITNDDVFEGETWIIQWTETGFDSDSLLATITPDDMYDLTNEEFTTEDDFRIDVDSTDDGCYYSIVKSTKPKVFDINARCMEFWATDRIARDNWIRDNCFNGIGYVKTATILDCPGGFGSVLSDSLWCYVVTDYTGTPGEIGSPQYEFETTWTVQTSGKGSESATVCSGTKTSNECSGQVAMIGDYARVEWQGSLSTGTECEQPGNEYAIHSNSFPDGWRVVDKAAYDDFYSYYYSLQTYKNDIQTWSLGGLTVTQVETKANSLSSNAIRQKTGGAFASQWSGSPDVEITSVDNGQIRWTPTDQRLLFPTFNLYVDGDYYLNVIKPCGDPEIISTTVDTIDEGTKKGVDIRVRNKGDYRGGFIVRIDSCTDGFIIEDQPVPVLLDAGSETTVTIRLGFESTSQTAIETGTCDVIMESTCSDDEFLYQADVEGKQMQDCTPGHRQCAIEGEEVVMCDVNGLVYDHYLYCLTNEQCIDGNCEMIPLLCGDGICGLGESYESCPADCETPPICGDGICAFGEALSCPIDCTEPDCTLDINCNDNEPCTEDRCIIGSCVNNLIPGCGGDDGIDWMMIFIIGGILAVVIVIVVVVAIVTRKPQTPYSSPSPYQYDQRY